MKTRSARSLIATARRTYSDMYKLANQYAGDKTLGLAFTEARSNAGAAKILIENSIKLPSDTALLPDEKAEISAEIYGYHLTGIYTIDELAEFYSLPPDIVRELAGRQLPNFNAGQIPVIE